MVKFRSTGTVRCADVDYAHSKYPNEEIIIVMTNTKEQDANEMERIAVKYPQVIFSVTGGLDPAKSKFNNEHYQRRTYYTARELSKIIAIYRGIEKRIDISWTETQKAMFVYRELCNRMQYSENVVNGRDYARGIGGLLYNKAVCAGFAMIYKEALDRLGIECYYQNRKRHHSWNIAKLDGKYRGLELTWDTAKKGENGCTFNYFNREGANFYSNEHHNIKHEPEEHEFPITPYTYEELVEANNIINQKRILKIPLVFDRRGFAETDEIKINGIPCIIRKDNRGNISVRCADQTQRIVNKEFARDDGTHFVLIPQKSSDSMLKKFLIIAENEEGIQVGKIYSEEELTSLSKEYDATIANGLLSRERLKRKIDDFNGYVGYVGTNHSIYYDQKVEKDKLNIIR